jgi:hypothetical protein
LDVPGLRAYRAYCDIERGLMVAAFWKPPPSKDRGCSAALEIKKGKAEGGQA